MNFMGNFAALQTFFEVEKKIFYSFMMGVVHPSGSISSWILFLTRNCQKTPANESWYQRLDIGFSSPDLLTSKVATSRCLKITEKSLIQDCERSELHLHFEWTKMVHFDEFLKTWYLRSNIVSRHVSFNRTKIGGKYENWQIQMRHFGWFFILCVAGTLWWWLRDWRFPRRELQI